MKYDFDAQLRDGHDGEAVLDTHFSEWFFITPASRDEQRRGIDRWWEPRDGGRALSVEYKTDRLATRSGNAFVETVSSDTHNKPGWAYASAAQLLCYYVPGDELVYLIDMNRLRSNLSLWTQRYRQRVVENVGYNTIGLLVPLANFERIARQVISL